MSDEPPRDPRHLDLLKRAYGEFEESVALLGTQAAATALEWVDAAFKGDPIGAMLDARSYPVLWMPRWADKDDWSPRSETFHQRIAYSTIHGYMFVRYIDNLVDGDAPAPIASLPAVGLFHTGFLMPYQEYFESGHPFWGLLETTWASALGASIVDATFETVTESDFEAVTARKTAGALIPVAASCYLTDSAEMISPWAGFIAEFSKWHQFHTDLLHWEKDHTHGNVTHLQSQYQRTSAGEISLGQWMKMDGLEWAIDIADTWLDQAITEAEVLDAPDLEAYLAYRRANATGEYASLRARVEREAITDELVAVFRRATGDPGV